MSVRAGDIVIYRNRDGVDMPAILTAPGPREHDGEQRYWHLHAFVPPLAHPDAISHEWGAPRAPDDVDPDGPDAWQLDGHWRPREVDPA